MGLFNIKITPKVKEREWEVKHLFTSRKLGKTCEVCLQAIPIHMPNTSFTKRVTTGAETKYQTFYTCGHKDNICTVTMANRLGAQL